MSDKNIIQEINTIAKFLSCQDISELNVQELERKYQISRADAIMVFGNELLHPLEAGVEAWKQEMADYLIFCGGVGHATELLRNNIQSHEIWRDLVKELEKKSEAEIYGELAELYFHVPAEKILLDTTSTNTGENAGNGLERLCHVNPDAQNIILLQDPLMQKRSKATLEWNMQKGNVISFASFIPHIREDFSFENDIPILWKKERFLKLLLGEMLRLQDDENGYGPKGKGFIGHVEIPDRVLEAYHKVLKYYEKDVENIR